jgi:hypothetical protein
MTAGRCWDVAMHLGRHREPTGSAYRLLATAGFVLDRVLVDRSLLRTETFTELLRALRAGEATHTVVPAHKHC